MVATPQVTHHWVMTALAVFHAVAFHVLEMHRATSVSKGHRGVHAFWPHSGEHALTEDGGHFLLLTFATDGEGHGLALLLAANQGLKLRKIHHPLIAEERDHIVLLKVSTLGWAIRGDIDHQQSKALRDAHLGSDWRRHSFEQQAEVGRWFFWCRFGVMRIGTVLSALLKFRGLLAIRLFLFVHWLLGLGFIGRCFIACGERGLDGHIRFRRILSSERAQGHPTAGDE